VVKTRKGVLWNSRRCGSSSSGCRRRRTSPPDGTHIVRYGSHSDDMVSNFIYRAPHQVGHKGSYRIGIPRCDWIGIPRTCFIQYDRWSDRRHIWMMVMVIQHNHRLFDLPIIPFSKQQLMIGGHSDYCMWWRGRGRRRRWCWCHFNNCGNIVGVRVQQSVWVNNVATNCTGASWKGRPCFPGGSFKRRRYLRGAFPHFVSIHQRAKH
jgi:hypothetical protein